MACEEELARQRVGEEFSAEGIASWKLELTACPRNREQSGVVGTKRAKGM